MDKKKLYFYLLRLRKSSLPELIYRTQKFHFQKKIKAQLAENKYPVTIPKIDCKDIKYFQLPSFYGKVSNKLVQKILSGELFNLNTDVAAIRKFEENHRQIFFMDIKFFNRQPDIRSVWEPARLQHLVILLKYISQTKESFEVHHVSKFIKNSVIDWIKKNPFLLGVHYISSMECGLRIPVFFYCLKSLVNMDVSESQLILDTIYRHAWWVSRHLSLYSSLGNHTVAECVGLIFAGAVFRKDKLGRQWLKTGIELLIQELDHQILEDGGPAEQSLNYHRFILDLYWLAIDFLEKNNLHNFYGYKERVTNGERFIIAFGDTHGRLSSIGDSDDAHAIAPGIYPKRIKPEGEKGQIQTFDSSGYTIINDNNTVLTLDHGPLGMAPLYNHGHADALSITLSLGGKEMLVDPGTYKYNEETEFRKYFKGTRAHNTVTIDGLDQAVLETGFIWSRPYKAKLVKNFEIDGAVFLEANHDGYARIDEPVWHFRSVINFDKVNFIIKDSFSGRGFHSFELNYHVHPDSETKLEENGWWKIIHQGAVIFMRLLNKNVFHIIKGQIDPLFGWYSPSYGIKRESAVLSCTMTGTPKEVSFITAICIPFAKGNKGMGI